MIRFKKGGSVIRDIFKEYEWLSAAYSKVIILAYLTKPKQRDQLCLCISVHTSFLKARLERIAGTYMYR